MKRYKIVEGSPSVHCCFEAAVVEVEIFQADSADVEGIMCECFDIAAAEIICGALNWAEENK
jgi:hypothetical protein